MEFVDFNPLLHWLQDTAIATTIRENESLFPWIETLHVAAIALVVGVNFDCRFAIVGTGLA